MTTNGSVEVNQSLWPTYLLGLATGLELLEETVYERRVDTTGVDLVAPARATQ